MYPFDTNAVKYAENGYLASFNLTFMSMGIFSSMLKMDI